MTVDISDTTIFGIFVTLVGTIFTLVKVLLSRTEKKLEEKIQMEHLSNESIKKDVSERFKLTNSTVEKSTERMDEIETNYINKFEKVYEKLDKMTELNHNNQIKILEAIQSQTNAMGKIKEDVAKQASFCMAVQNNKNHN